MRMMTKFLGITLALTALTAIANAQTVVYEGIGSSALFLQLGQAAGTSVASNGVGATCVWSQLGSPNATYPTVYPLESIDAHASPTLTETGNAWIAWTQSTATGSTCATMDSSVKIYAQLQTDSVIGDRSYFNAATLSAVTSPASKATNNLIFATGEQATLPAAIWTALSGHVFTAAATDIRPEDAKFATVRALATCDTAVGSSQYMGLGYTSRSTPIQSYYSNSTFHVVDFALPTDGSFSVIPIGAVPVVVAVNPSNASGFGNTSVTNITRSQLAKFLDGTYGNVSDLSGSGTAAATVLIREPLSGTYNTMEYATPNNLTLQTSQDVGLNQITAERNCTGGGTGATPITAANILGTSGYTLHIPSNDNASAYRNRAIGTGQEVSELLSVTDALGYSFWSTANFANATSTNAKYLQVDGVDPLQSSYSAGVIPTSGNGLLSNVNFAHLQDGTYPIWSLLRLVSASSGSNLLYAKKLGTAAQYFISATSRPDFVPFSVGASGTTLKVLHSHFVPPTVTFSSSNTPANGSNAFTPPLSATGTCSAAEIGGDVGGAILTVTSDQSYCTAHGVTTGDTGLRM
jgi:hypothetical protein